MLHLDVKPSNILIEPVSKTDPMSLHPWVIDFGLVNVAASRDGDDPAGLGDRGRQTRGFGTKGFMAPEMIVLRDANGDATFPPPTVGRHSPARPTSGASASRSTNF